MGRIAVCSWSLQPRDHHDLAESILQCGLDAAQLALEPVRSGAMALEPLVRRLDDAGITVVSGMMAMAGEDYATLESIRRTGGVVPDETWPANLDAARQNAVIAHTLGIPLVTFHAGFIPHDPQDPRRRVLIDRLRRIADTFGREDIRIALETGQEDAETMAGLMPALAPDGVGINFDPANMILYGTGDPILALDVLADHVMQVHVKDAVASRVPGEWGTEVPVGEGSVEWADFFATLDAHELQPDWVIEREAGDQRIADVRQAAAVIDELH